jgi:hypothetical protein
MGVSAGLKVLILHKLFDYMECSPCLVKMYNLCPDHFIFPHNVYVDVERVCDVLQSLILQRQAKKAQMLVHATREFILMEERNNVLSLSRKHN